MSDSAHTFALVGALGGAVLAAVSMLGMASARFEKSRKLWLVVLTTSATLMLGGVLWLRARGEL